MIFVYLKVGKLLACSKSMLTVDTKPAMRLIMISLCIMYALLSVSFFVMNIVSNCAMGNSLSLRVNKLKQIANSLTDELTGVPEQNKS